MNLLLLTKYYPFGMGEAFVENEIKELSKSFDSIYIIACEVLVNDNCKRELPKNVKAYKVPIKNRTIQSVFDMLSGIKYMFSADKVLNDEYYYCNGIVQRSFLGYFEAKSRRTYKYIVKQNYIDNIGSSPFVLYSYWLFMTARVGTYIKDKQGDHIPYSFTRSHGYDLYEKRNATKYLPFRRLFLLTYDNIFPCSDNGTEYLKLNYPEYCPKIRTALLGTQDHGISESSKDGIFRIVSCSRIEDVKRVHRIAEALILLEDSGFQIEWTHIGGGKKLNTIKKISSKNFINIKVNLLGNLSNIKVIELYKRSTFDLFVNVSSSEGLPVSIMEAISFGIPVIATNVGGTSEIVHDNITGKLIANEFKNEELANEIKHFVKLSSAQEQEYLLIKKNCRRYWLKYFQAVENYTSFCKLIFGKLK